jgi:hypothetical protein
MCRRELRRSFKEEMTIFLTYLTVATLLFQDGLELNLCWLPLSPLVDNSNSFIDTVPFSRGSARMTQHLSLLIRLAYCPLLWVSFVAYFLTLKKELKCSLEPSDISEIQGFTTQKKTITSHRILIIFQIYFPAFMSMK